MLCNLRLQQIRFTRVAPQPWQGDQYDVREKGGERDVRNLGKPVELAGRYYDEGADEVTFLNIMAFR